MNNEQLLDENRKEVRIYEREESDEEIRQTAKRIFKAILVSSNKEKKDD